jgi:hypothetical protein
LLGLRLSGLCITEIYVSHETVNSACKKRHIQILWRCSLLDCAVTRSTLIRFSIMSLRIKSLCQSSPLGRGVTRRLSLSMGTVLDRFSLI